MKAYVVQGLIGVFGFDEKGKLIDYVLFPRDAEAIARKFLEDKITVEEKNLIKRLSKKGYSKFFSTKKDENYEFDFENFGLKIFRNEFRKITRKLGFSDIELNQLLSEIGVELTRQRIKKSVGKDRIVIQVVNAIDEIDKSLNIFVSRLREWYGLHFPELNRLVEKHEKFVKIVSEFGSRENIKEKEFLEIKKESMGIELNERDEAILKEYATKIKELYKLRNHLEKYIDDILKEISPNLRELAGPLLAARLIALSGGLEKLAKKPSSTIQLIGAEKALFRFLRGRGKSPKYGLLFMHPLVQNAPLNKRGRVARILASKLSIAAKMDYYGKKDISKKLEKNMEDKIKRMSE